MSEEWRSTVDPAGPAESNEPAGSAEPGPEELRRAREVLEAVVQDRALLAQIPLEERTRFLMAAGRAMAPETDQKRRLVKGLRKARRRQVEARDRALLARTGIRAARESTVFVAPARSLPSGTRVEEPREEVLKPRTCYVCKVEYRRIHPFYDALCPACADLNYEKRFQAADLQVLPPQVDLAVSQGRGLGEGLPGYDVGHSSPLPSGKTCGGSTARFRPGTAGRRDCPIPRNRRSRGP